MRRQVLTKQLLKVVRDFCVRHVVSVFKFQEFIALRELEILAVNIPQLSHKLFKARIGG